MRIKIPFVRDEELVVDLEWAGAGRKIRKRQIQDLHQNNRKTEEESADVEEGAQEDRDFREIHLSSHKISPDQPKPEEDQGKAGDSDEVPDGDIVVGI